MTYAVDEFGLAIQDLKTLDIGKLTPLSPEVISRQATINVGTIGHVAHGKSTVVKALTGLSTIRHKSEKERNITIKLGYANAKVYKAKNQPDETKQYTSRGSTTEDSFTENGVEYELKRHISFVDCPGHDILMATMLNGATVMDAALLLIAGNESCPQPQTSEHLAAVEIMQLKNIIILQNKIELVKQEQAEAQFEEIKSFVRGTSAETSPVIPISAVLKYNIDILAQYLCTQIPIPPRDFTSSPHMIVIRSFDVNKPGEEIQKLKGGVAGGSILKGVLKAGSDIEIRPGVVEKEGGVTKCKPIRSTIVNLKSEKNELQYAVPGGLIAVGTNIDPTLTRQDNLVGSILGLPGHVPEIFTEIEIKFRLLSKLLGVKSKDGDSAKVKKLKQTYSELLMINVGATSVGGKVVGVRKDAEGFDKAKIELVVPVCAKIGDKVALSRKIEKHWRLIGWGEILKGSTLKL